MTADITRLVDTRFTATDLASGPMMALHGVANGVGGALQRVTSHLNPIGMALTAIGTGASIAGIISLNSEFENTSQTLAGFLSAMGFAKDFNAGLDLAASTMKSINTAAAALPGEAEDYIRVFKQGLPVMQKAVGGTLEDITKFSNRYTAVMSSLQVDSAQSARDMSHMLRSGVGGAGLDVKSWTSILPFIQQVKGQSNLAAQEFNKMTETKRVELLNAAFDKLQPRIDAASSSWDAMSGAAKSAIKIITRESSTPLFEGMKEGMGVFNSALVKSDGDLTRLGQGIVNVGQLITRHLVGSVKAIPRILQEADDHFGGLSAKAGIWAGHLVSAGNRAASTTEWSTRQHGGEAVSAVSTGAMVGASLGPAGMILGATLGAFATHGNEVVDVFRSTVTIVEQVVDAAGPFLNFMMTTAMLLGDIAAAVLPGFMEGIVAVTGPILMFMSALWTIGEVIIQQLRPSLALLWTSVGNLISALGDFLGPVITLVGRALLTVWDVAAEYLVPILKEVFLWLGKFIDGISTLLRYLGRQIGKMNGDAPSAKGDSSSGVWDALSKLGDNLKKATSGNALDAKSTAPHAAAARGHGGKVTQDFRYSKFTLENKFDKDWDVDRIVTTLFDKVAAVGTKRLKSGFDPMFAF